MECPRDFWFGKILLWSDAEDSTLAKDVPSETKSAKDKEMRWNHDFTLKFREGSYYKNSGFEKLVIWLTGGFEDFEYNNTYISTKIFILYHTPYFTFNNKYEQCM